MKPRFGIAAIKGTGGTVEAGTVMTTYELPRIGERLVPLGIVAYQDCQLMVSLPARLTEDQVNQRVAQVRRHIHRATNTPSKALLED